MSVDNKSKITIVVKGKGLGLVHEFECGCHIGAHLETGIFFVKCMNHWRNEKRIIRLGYS